MGIQISVSARRLSRGSHETNSVVTDNPCAVASRQCLGQALERFRLRNDSVVTDNPCAAAHGFPRPRLAASPAGSASLRLARTQKNRAQARFFCLSAQERTRTSMPLRALPPQGSTSTNFATCAWGYSTAAGAVSPASAVSSTFAEVFIIRVRRSWRRASRATFSRM